MKKYLLVGMTFMMCLILVGCATKTTTPTVDQKPTTETTIETTTTTNSEAEKTTDSVPMSYTSIQVAEHGTQSDYWSIVNGKVYNLTSYIPRHPGGPEKIIQICGKDGSSLFENKHGGEPKPEMMLAKLYLGELTK